MGGVLFFMPLVKVRSDRMRRKPQVQPLASGHGDKRIYSTTWYGHSSSDVGIHTLIHYLPHCRQANLHFTLFLKGKRQYSWISPGPHGRLTSVACATHSLTLSEMHSVAVPKCSHKHVDLHRTTRLEVRALEYQFQMQMLDHRYGEKH